MPQKKTVQRARKDKRQGKAASTQAGAFVREEIHEIRAGKHGARSPEQAIAIGLSKARRAGVKLPPPARGKATASTRKSAARAYEEGQGKRRPAKSAKRARAAAKALKREPTRTVSTRALSAHAKRVAAGKSPAARSAAARKAARTREHRVH